ncbi:hypothetical protein [Thalassolituus sp. UBA3500]|uniref:hypothetical protein n=1 Tax=Thalassolituus sp. UBA3500 TaxID=1947664 RepID=UPI000C11FA63|nr:hypothetical protein [Thalassolituus sp. UBA3500]MBN58713.1 hypothetical protein [Oceanospirillaceae bacterium]|tara:strand:+ start:1106 stop:1498 length:393 start_codon:yes stop_codon:yes gene_type:complete
MSSLRIAACFCLVAIGSHVHSGETSYWCWAEAKAKTATAKGIREIVRPDAVDFQMLLKWSGKEYRLLNLNDDVLLGSCNQYGSYCEEEENFSGIFIRDPELNNFNYTYLGAYPGEGVEMFLVTGSCAAID